MVHPYSLEDLLKAEKIVRELHGLVGFDAWAERIAKALAAEKADIPTEDVVRRMRSEEWPER